MGRFLDPEVIIVNMVGINYGLNQLDTLMLSIERYASPSSVRFASHVTI